MTRTTAVLLGVVLLLLFAALELWLASLSDTRADRAITMRDPKTGNVLFNCYSQPPVAKLAKKGKTSENRGRNTTAN